VNRIIALGLDEHWRKLAARECLSGNPERVLDLCTGTGDLALQMALRKNGVTNIQALDYSAPMLSLAREKAQRKAPRKIQFIQGDAADMPFESASLDAIGIGFAFRNLTWKNPDRDRFLSEIIRVLRPGGKFVIVESSQPSSAMFSKIFRLYLKLMVGGLGGMISGHKGAYLYLAASARDFYSPKEVREMILEAGFKQVSHRPLGGGVAGLTIALK
jgi:demethylmenaquinone methyltransferase/2-methoxy-6-polyprenyl-1,4-benzoquinol methylase